MARTERVQYWRGKHATRPDDTVPGRLLVEQDTGDVFLDYTDPSDQKNKRTQLTDTRKIDAAGGTFTGPVILSADQSDSTNPLAAATKNSVDTVANALRSHENTSSIHVTSSEKTNWNNKVDKILDESTGMYWTLSQENFSHDDKDKLDSIYYGANKVEYHQAEWVDQDSDKVEIGEILIYDTDNNEVENNIVYSPGKVKSAEKLALKQTIDGVKFDGSSSINHFVTCTTDGNVQIKSTTKSDFVYEEGAEVFVYFTKDNTFQPTGSNSIQLLISKGSIPDNPSTPIYKDGNPIAADDLKSGLYCFILRKISEESQDLVFEMASGGESYELATQTSKGLMSADDKYKLDHMSESGLPIATREDLGGVIVGDNISLEADGTISVSSQDVVSALGFEPVDGQDVIGTLPAFTGALTSEQNLAENYPAAIDFLATISGSSFNVSVADDVYTFKISASSPVTVQAGQYKFNAIDPLDTTNFIVIELSTAIELSDEPSTSAGTLQFEISRNESGELDIPDSIEVVYITQSTGVTNSPASIVNVYTHSPAESDTGDAVLGERLPNGSAIGYKYPLKLKGCAQGDPAKRVIGTIATRDLSGYFPDEVIGEFCEILQQDSPDGFEAVGVYCFATGKLYTLSNGSWTSEPVTRSYLEAPTDLIETGEAISLYKILDETSPSPNELYSGICTYNDADLENTLSLGYNTFGHIFPYEIAQDGWTVTMDPDPDTGEGEDDTYNWSLYTSDFYVHLSDGPGGQGWYLEPRSYLIRSGGYLPSYEDHTFKVYGEKLIDASYAEFTFTTAIDANSLLVELEDSTNDTTNWQLDTESNSILRESLKSGYTGNYLVTATFEEPIDETVDSGYSYYVTAVQGQQGLVPAPDFEDANKFLRGNGEWSDLDAIALSDEEIELICSRGDIVDCRVYDAKDMDQIIAESTYRGSAAIETSGGSIQFAATILTNEHYKLDDGIYIDDKYNVSWSIDSWSFLDATAEGGLDTLASISSSGLLTAAGINDGTVAVKAHIKSNRVWDNTDMDVFIDVSIIAQGTPFISRLRIFDAEDNYINAPLIVTGDVPFDVELHCEVSIFNPKISTTTTYITTSEEGHSLSDLTDGAFDDIQWSVVGGIGVGSINALTGVYTQNSDVPDPVTVRAFSNQGVSVNPVVEARATITYSE